MERLILDGLSIHAMAPHLMNTRKLSLLSVLAAMCLALQLSPRPPNVEFTSFFTFIVGLAYGVLAGSLFGCSVMFVNAFVSPYGFAGMIMPFQMIGMAIPGVIGGVYGRRMPEGSAYASFCLETAVMGALSALIFDLITNVGAGLWYVSSGVDLGLAMLTAIAYGTFFSVIHVTSNATVFGMLTLPSVKVLSALVEGKQIG